MKKLAIFLGVILVFLLAVSVHAGESLGNLDPGIAPPNSMAFGKSLDEWVEAYLRWLEDGADPAARIRNVAFLPIICPYTPGPSEPCIFEVEVEPGTALVLPMVMWLGECYEDGTCDEPLPDEWFGDPAYVFGVVSLDGEPIIEPNTDYYVGPTDLVPPLWDTYIFYQGIACVILPLPAGEHQIVLHSEFVFIPSVFDNVWNITVVPPGQR